MSAEIGSFLSASMADQKPQDCSMALCRSLSVRSVLASLLGGGKAKKGAQKTFCLLLPKWLFVAFCLSMAS